MNGATGFLFCLGPTDCCIRTFSSRRLIVCGGQPREWVVVCPLGRCVGRISPKIGAMTDMTKWEYATVPLLTHATKQILDTWGEDGWELVTVMPGPNPENVVAYMKRPVNDSED